MAAPIDRRWFLLGLAAIVPAAGALAADETTVARLIADLKTGGFVIYFRHGETGRSGADRPQAVMGDCSTQRNLDDAGRAQVRRMGEDFRRLAIPVGKALSSEFCRCWQHAEAMFGKDGYCITDKLTLAASYPAVTEADRKLNNENLRALLAEVPKPGTNTVLVSHGNNVLLLTGFHPNVQGEAVIFKPDGAGGYTRVASVLPADWTRAGR